MRSKKCKLCGDKTPYVVNIKFKAVSVCNECCNSIFLQQAQWFGKRSADLAALEIKKYE